VICGEGVIDVFVRRDGGFARLERIPTAKGARTGLLVPALDRLMLAVRASGAASAAIRIYQPVP